MRPTTAISVATILSLASLAGCSSNPNGASDRASTAAAASVSTPPVTAETSPGTGGTGSRIPDGTWTRVVTRTQARGLDLDAATLKEMLGADGRLPIALKLAGDRWSMFVTSDTGKVEVGDLGSARYDSRGHWVTTSESQGCAGCVGLMNWKVRGNRLTLTFAPGGDVDDGARLVVGGTYQRAS